MTRNDWPYLSEWTDKRSGKIFRRVRKAGRVAYLPADCPKSDKRFTDAYHAAINGAEIAPKPFRGSLDDLAHRYYASAEFRSLAPGTVKGYRFTLGKLLKDHGDKPVKAIERQHIRALMNRETADGANKLLKMFRILMAFAVEEGVRSDNPTLGLKRVKVHSDGFHSWTDAEILQFRERHASGTKERLAFELFYNTAQRRGDVVRMGWSDIEGEAIRVRQAKTGALLWIPLHPDLRRELEIADRFGVTLLLTKFRKPFSKFGFGAWFRRACDQADLPKHCAAHGLRKAAARTLAEVGCTTEEIKALTGHSSSAEVDRYVKAANQRKLAGAAILRLERNGGKT